MPAFAGAAALRDFIHQLLRQSAHDLLAAAVMERRDVRQRKAGSAKVAGALDQTGASAGTRCRDRRDGPGRAAADDDDVKIRRLHLRALRREGLLFESCKACERVCCRALSVRHVSPYIGSAQALNFIQRVQGTRRHLLHFTPHLRRQKFGVHCIAVTGHHIRSMQQDIEPLRTGQHGRFNHGLKIRGGTLRKRPLDAVRFRAVIFNFHRVLAAGGSAEKRWVTHCA